jgi:hypothetical protein
MPGARHCEDLLMRNAKAKVAIMATVDGVLEQMKAWIKEFYEGKPERRHTLAAGQPSVWTDG